MTVAAAGSCEITGVLSLHDLVGMNAHTLSPTRPVPKSKQIAEGNVFG